MDVHVTQPCVAAITRSDLRIEGADYVHIAGDWWLPAGDARSELVALADAEAHPEGIAYVVPAIARAMVHGSTRAGAVILGFGALAVHGLPYCVDAADVIVMDPKVARSVRASAGEPGVRRRGCSTDEICEAVFHSVRVQIATAPVACVQALVELVRGNHSWPTIPIPDTDPLTVQAVMLIHACRRHLGLSPDDIIAASHGRLDQRWLRRMLKLSSAKADSPKETELRLLVLTFARERNLKLSEQVPVYRRGHIVTTLDLAFEEQRIGLMYDGEHHMEFNQFQKDARINAELVIEKWTALRISSWSMGSVLEWLDELL